MTDLKKLCGDRYVVVDDGTNDPDRSERVWCLEIRGRHGAIYPYGFNGSLAVRVESRRVARRVAALGLRIVQRGDWETVFVFEPSLVHVIAAMIEARKRRRLSPEARAKATRNLLQHHARLAKPGLRPPDIHSEAVSESQDGLSDTGMGS